MKLQRVSPLAGSRTGRRQRRLWVSLPFFWRKRQLTPAPLPRTLAIETSTRSTWPAPLIVFDEVQPGSREPPFRRTPRRLACRSRRRAREIGGRRSGQALVLAEPPPPAPDSPPPAGVDVATRS